MSSTEMLYGIAAMPVHSDLAYAQAINDAANEVNFSPPLAYAIANRESIRGERNGKWIAAHVVSGDGGHGLFQLTSWFPAIGWDNPRINAHWAIVRWLQPSVSHYAAHHGYRGDILIDAVADAFNAGQGTICTLCDRGENPDHATTDSDYGRDVLMCYRALITDRPPT
jgi:hypothetical protein